jgi:hypothetical protein
MNCSSPYSARGRRLVLALQRAVVPLVEPPGALHRDPAAVSRRQRDLRGVDRPGQQGGVQHLGQQPGLHQQLTAALRLAAALVVQVDVHPAGEQVLRVPLALAVAQQDQRRGHGQEA